MLETGLASHLARVEDAPDDTPSISLRQDLEALFVRLIRRSARTAVSAFAYLGLVALDLERLRWGLARRCAFPTVRGLSRWD